MKNKLFTYEEVRSIIDYVMSFQKAEDYVESANIIFKGDREATSAELAVLDSLSGIDNVSGAISDEDILDAID